MGNLPARVRILGAACLTAWAIGCGGDSGTAPNQPGPSQTIPGVNTSGIIAYTHPPSGVKLKVPEAFRLLLESDSSFYLSLEGDSAILLMHFTRQKSGESLDAMEERYRNFSPPYMVARFRQGEVDRLELNMRQELPTGTRRVFTDFLDQDGARLKIGYSMEEGRLNTWGPLAEYIVRSATLK